MRRRALYAIAAALCLAAAAGIAALLAADSYFIEINLGYTAGGLLVYGTAALVGASTRGSFAWVGWAGAILAIAAFGFFAGALWEAEEETATDQTLLKLTGSFSVFAFALLYEALVLSRMAPGGGRLVTRLVAVASLAVFAVATLITVAIVADVGDETYFSVAAVIAVLWALATALIPVARGLRPPVGATDR